MSLNLDEFIYLGQSWVFTASLYNTYRPR